MSHIYTLRSLLFDLYVVGMSMLILFDLILLGIMFARIITYSPGLKESAAI